jgi:hypothetical protein
MVTETIRSIGSCLLPLAKPLAVRSVHQRSRPVQSRFDYLPRIGAAHSRNIGLIDQPQIAIWSAEPHRHRRGFDQRRPAPQNRSAPAPHHRAAGPVRSHCRKNRTPRPAPRRQERLADRPNVRAARGCVSNRAASRPCGTAQQSLACRTASVSSAKLFGGEAPASAINPPPSSSVRKCGTASSPSQPASRCGASILPSARTSSGSAGRFVDHPGQPLGMALAGLGLSFARARRTDRPKGSHGPPGQHQANQDQRGGSERHGRQLCAHGCIGKRCRPVIPAKAGMTGRLTPRSLQGGQRSPVKPGTTLASIAVMIRLERPSCGTPM